jgi:hypothetical protein
MRSTACTLTAAIVAVAAFALAGAAHAEEIASSGFIEDVDIDSGTVEIDRQIYRVTFRSQLLDEKGERLTLRNLDVMNPGPWVQYRATDRAGDREIDQLSIVPEDE